MFENADLLHAYTRADALRDGVIIDMSATARKTGIPLPLALTRGGLETVWCWSANTTTRCSTWSGKPT